jgi:uncharacterized membrane protein
MINFLFTNTPLAYLIQSLWRDEAFSYLLAKKNLLQILYLTAKDFNPPLYYLLLHFWMKVFGGSEIALRSLSLIFFWATVYIGFLFMTDIFKYSQKKAFFYLAFFLINPLLNYYAFEARMYSLFSFFAILSFYSLLTNQKKIYFWSTLLGLFTHYFMIGVFAAQLIIYLIFKKSKINNQKVFDFKILISPFILSLTWLLLVLIFKQSTSSFWIKSLTLNNFLLIPASLFTGYEFGFRFFDKKIIYFSWLIFIVIFFGMIIKKQKREKDLSYILIFWSSFIPILSAICSLFFPIFLPRYLIFAAIGLVLLIIFIIDKLPPLIKFVAIVLIFYLCFNYNNEQIRYRKKEDWRKIITEIKSLAKKEDILYVTDVLYYHPVIYYFDEKRVFIYQKNYDGIPDYVGKVLIPREKIINYLPIFPKKAFIINSPYDYQIQSSL